MGPIGHNNETCFLANQEFLDDHPMSCRPKGMTAEHVFNGLNGFSLAGRHHDPLAGGEAIGFDDNRGALLLDVSDRWGDLGETLVSGRRNVVSGHKVFTKGFRSFELGGQSAGPKTGESRLAEGIDNAKDQWDLRSDDGQINLLVLGKVEKALNIISGDRDVFKAGFKRRPSVSWGDIDFLGIG